MTSSAVIVSYEPWHGEYLAPRLHPANKAEIWSLLHKDGLSGIQASVRSSTMAWTGLDRDGNPVAIFGVRTAGIFGEDEGYPWLVCREDIASMRIAFLRTFRTVVGMMLEIFGSLSGYIDARNGELIKMCEWAGFTVEEAKPFGMDGLPFHRIVIKRGER